MTKAMRLALIIICLQLVSIAQAHAGVWNVLFDQRTGLIKSLHKKVPEGGFILEGNDSVATLDIQDGLDMTQYKLILGPNVLVLKDRLLAYDEADRNVEEVYLSPELAETFALVIRKIDYEDHICINDSGIVSAYLFASPMWKSSSPDESGTLSFSSPRTEPYGKLLTPVSYLSAGSTKIVLSSKGEVGEDVLLIGDTGSVRGMIKIHYLGTATR